MALDDFSDKIEKHTSLRIGFKKIYQKNEKTETKTKTEIETETETETKTFHL